MNLASLFSAEMVVCDLKGKDRREVYLELLGRLQQEVPEIGSTENIYNEITEHEKLIDMPYQMGFAVPHTRSSLLTDFYIVVGIHEKGILLQEEDIDPSKVIIMCLISKSTSDLYLLALRSIYSYFSRPGVVDEVATCKEASELLAILERDKVEVKHTLAVEDIMNSDFSFLHTGANVKEAIDLFISQKVSEIPILNDGGCLLGTVSTSSLLKQGVPDYVLMMETHAFLNSFAPFERLLTHEESWTVEEILDQKPHICNKDFPAAQLVIGFIKEHVSTYYVVDENKKLLGTVSQLELVKKLLRG